MKVWVSRVDPKSESGSHTSTPSRDVTRVSYQGITVDDIIVKTKIGGWTGGGYPGDFVDSTLADHSLKPIMTDVRSRSREVSPHALAFDHAKGHLYFADFNARSIERVKIVRSVDRKGGLTVDAVVEWDTFLPDVGEMLLVQLGGRRWITWEGGVGTKVGGKEGEGQEIGSDEGWGGNQRRWVSSDSHRFRHSWDKKKLLTMDMLMYT